MEEIIVLIKQKYKSNFLYMELFDDLSGRLNGNDFTVLYAFNSLEDLRNHLNS